MNDAANNRGVIALLIAVIIALLLLMRNGSRNITLDNRTQTPGSVEVAPVTNNYDVGSIEEPSSDFDWMQTTNLACDCDEAVWSQPTIPQQPKVEVFSYPVYSYVEKPVYIPVKTIETVYVNVPVERTPVVYNPAPVINPVFQQYVPPPPPTWWLDTLRDVDGKMQQIRKTSDGELFRLGKYGTFRENTHRYTEYTISGVDMYYGTRHYIHDGSRDVYPGLAPQVPGNSIMRG